MIQTLIILSIGPSVASSFDDSEISSRALAPAASPDIFMSDSNASLAMTYLDESTWLRRTSCRKTPGQPRSKSLPSAVPVKPCKKLKTNNYYIIINNNNSDGSLLTLTQNTLNRNSL